MAAASLMKRGGTKAVWLAVALAATAVPSTVAFSALAGGRGMALRVPSAAIHATEGRISHGSSRRTSTSRGAQMAIEGTGIYIGAGLYAGQWKTGVGMCLCVCGKHGLNS